MNHSRESRESPKFRLSAKTIGLLFAERSDPIPAVREATRAGDLRIHCSRRGMQLRRPREREECAGRINTTFLQRGTGPQARLMALARTFDDHSCAACLNKTRRLLFRVRHSARRLRPHRLNEIAPRSLVVRIILQFCISIVFILVIRSP